MKEKQTGSCESCTYYIYDDEYEVIFVMSAWTKMSI